MNLSVRRQKTRRAPGGLGINFGLPMRVKMPLPALSEPGNELDGITELECTMDESRPSCEPEAAPSSQGAGSSIRSASSSSETERESEQKPPPTRESHKETTGHKLEQCVKRNTVEAHGVLTPHAQTTASQVYKQQRTSTVQEGSQSFTTNPQSTLLNNSSRQQGDVSNSSLQQTLHQMPTPQGLSSTHNLSGNASSTIQQQSSNSITPAIGRSCSLSQQNIPQVSHSGQLQAIPGQFQGAGYAPGYPQEMQFARPMVIPAQSSQGTIVVKGKSYQRLGTIGKGGSSKVNNDCFFFCS